MTWPFHLPEPTDAFAPEKDATPSSKAGADQLGLLEGMFWGNFGPKKKTDEEEPPPSLAALGWAGGGEGEGG